MATSALRKLAFRYFDFDTHGMDADEIRIARIASEHVTTSRKLVGGVWKLTVAFDEQAARQELASAGLAVPGEASC